MLVNSKLSVNRKTKLLHFTSLFHILSYDFLVLLALMCIGFLSLYSAASGSIYPWAFKQLIFFCFGILLIYFISSINIKIIYKLSYFIFFLSFLFLLFALIFGKSSKGATRWIDFKIFKFQPSEFAKLGLILFFARYRNSLSFFYKKYITFTLIIPLFFSLPIFILIAIQPDLATSIIILIIIVTYLFFSNISMKFFIFSGISVLIMAPFAWIRLHSYQKLRILNFLDPERDPLGSGYNIIQSKIAIGSGGFFGKGFLNGTQGRLRFLPEHQTDFVFTIIAEEFGFLGFLFLLFCYFVILIYGYKVALAAKNEFSRLIAILSTVLIFFHIAFNISMTCGLVPVAGIPLPLISAGGTMSVIFCILYGLIKNIDLNKDVNI